MKQFRVTFTQTLIREVVIEATSLEAARRVADVLQKALIDDDFNRGMTTYDLREVDDDTCNDDTKQNHGAV